MPVKLNGADKALIRKAAEAAGWIDGKPDKPVNRPDGGKWVHSGGCYSGNCWHCFWGVGYDEGGTVTGLHIAQAGSAREARDKAYFMAAKVLKAWAKRKRRKPKGMTTAEATFWALQNIS